MTDEHTGADYQVMAYALLAHIPDAGKVVACPVHGEKYKGQRDWRQVYRMVIHLNDQTDWTREQIADWLDSLDLDLTVRAEAVDREPRDSSVGAAAKAAGLHALVGGGSWISTAEWMQVQDYVAASEVIECATLSYVPAQMNIVTKVSHVGKSHTIPELDPLHVSGLTLDVTTYDGLQLRMHPAVPTAIMDILTAIDAAAGTGEQLLYTGPMSISNLSFKYAPSLSFKYAPKEES